MYNSRQHWTKEYTSPISTNLPEQPTTTAVSKLITTSKENQQDSAPKRPTKTQSNRTASIKPNRAATLKTEPHVTVTPPHFLVIGNSNTESNGPASAETSQPVTEQVFTIMPSSPTSGSPPNFIRIVPVIQAVNRNIVTSATSVNNPDSQQQCSEASGSKTATALQTVEPQTLNSNSVVSVQLKGQKRKSSD